MNKAELVDAMASNAGLSKADAKRALDGFIDATGVALKKGERISLVGFGSFSVSNRKARLGRNPQTGKEIQIAAKNVVRFKAGSDLSGKVNQDNHQKKQGIERFPFFMPNFIDMTIDEKVLKKFYNIITESKQVKYDQIAADRTRYLTVVMESISKEHNSSAVLRTCDCFGIQDLHTIEKGNFMKVTQKQKNA